MLIGFVENQLILCLTKSLPYRYIISLDFFSKSILSIIISIYKIQQNYKWD